MTIEESSLAPRIYHLNDPDDIFALWKTIIDSFSSTERGYASSFQELIDPDTCPSDFLAIMLKQLGNPFINVVLTETQKRKLVKLLIPIYKQKGTAIGIVNAVRFLLGIEIDLADPHGNEEDGWQVGRAEIGRNSYVGGEAVYCNLLDYSEDLTMAEWDKTDVTVVPSDETGPAPWYRDADRVTMADPTSVISQTVEPLFVGNETFSGMIYLKAEAPVSLKFRIYATDDPTDYTEEVLSVTTTWTKFECTHTMTPLQLSPRVTYEIYTDVGLADDVFFFGMQMVRSDDPQPYQMTTDDGDDCSSTGRWAYHFLMTVTESLTDSQDAIIRSVADYMKPVHTHYTLITPDVVDPDDIIDHWEIDLSEIGVNTFVHDTP